MLSFCESKYVLARPDDGNFQSHDLRFRPPLLMIDAFIIPRISRMEGPMLSITKAKYVENLATIYFLVL